MKQQLKQVKDFHKAFGAVVNDSPNLDTKETQDLREKLMMEELKEIMESVRSGDKVNTLKELSDALYVLLGSVVSFGYTDVFEEAFTRVHEANMSKLDKDGKVIMREDGKVLKSDQYRPADLSDLV